MQVPLVDWGLRRGPPWRTKNKERDASPPIVGQASRVFSLIGVHKLTFRTSLASVNLFEKVVPSTTWWQTLPDLLGKRGYCIINWPNEIAFPKSLLVHGLPYNFAHADASESPDDEWSAVGILPWSIKVASQSANFAAGDGVYHQFLLSLSPTRTRPLSRWDWFF
ncbi:hypothetical protein BJ165DRAFT_1408223 [Panaeolus papilionaceus]|nr:hypothetical protein BJ165DRAFT_1408223 [Panaeolus papilionaceus]